MASIAEKDILIEELAGVMATRDRSNEKLFKAIANLREWLYDTNPKDMDFNEILKKIEELKNGIF